MEVDVQVGNEIITVEAPDNATDEQIIAAVKGQSATNSVAPRQRTDLEAATNVVQSIRQGRTEDLGQVGKDTLQLTSAPFRGVRGLAVGAGRALAGEGFQPSLQRASEAMQPGFKPETTAEKVASASSGLLEIAAPIGQAGRATRIGRGFTQITPFTKGAAAGKIAKLKEAVGVITEKAIDPIRSTKEANQFVNAVTKLRKQNILKALGPQELHEAEVKLRNLLDAERVGGFARLFGAKGAGKLTDQGKALAAKAKDAVVKAQNELTPGLEGARRTYGDLAARDRLLKRAALVGAAEVGRRTIGQPASSVVTEVAR